MVYDPTTGRFSSLDPFDGDPGDPQSFNKYVYVKGDPIQLVDPTGEFGVLAAVSTGLGVASLGSATFNILSSVQLGADAQRAFNNGQPYSALVNYALSTLNAGFAIADFFAAATFFAGAGAGGGPANPGFAVSLSGGLSFSTTRVATKAALQELLIKNGAAINGVFGRALAGRLSLAFAASHTNPFDPADGVAQFGNWSWQAPAQPSQVSDLLPSIGSTNSGKRVTFGHFDVLGHRAYLQSTGSTNSRIYNQIWKPVVGSLS